jgi:hypothetical protein
MIIACGNTPGECCSSRAPVQWRSSSRWASHPRGIRLKVRGVLLRGLLCMYKCVISPHNSFPPCDERRTFRDDQSMTFGKGANVKE